METKLTFTPTLVTPIMAAEMLTHNSANRPLNRFTVDRYKGEILKGNWRENPTDPITFAEDGSLLNGQHRLTAVVKAATSVWMIICRGADRRDFSIIDTGKNRSFADILALKGVSNYTAVGSIVKTYLLLQRNAVRTTPFSPRSLGETNFEMLNEYESSPYLYQDAQKLASSIYSACKFLPKGETGGILVYLVKEKRHDIEEVKRFFEEIAGSSQYKVLASLRNRLIRATVSPSKKDSLDPHARRCLISKAWNLYIKGEDQKSVSYRTGDRYNFD